MLSDDRIGLDDTQLEFLVYFRLILVAVFIPLYLGLITILLTQKQFHSVVAYNIMVQIGCVDVLCLLTVGLAALMSIYLRNFAFIAKLATYFRCLYFVALFSFSFLLALNRFFVYNQVTKLRASHYKYLAALSWLLSFLILPLCLALHRKTETEYDFLFALYFADGFVAQKVVRGLEITFYAGTIVTYLAIVALIVIKRVKFNLKVKLSSPETRVLLQAFLLFFPPVVVFGILMSMFRFDVTGVMLLRNRSVVLAVNVIYDLLPAINLVVQVAFNPAIKGFIRALLTRGPKSTTVRIVSISKILQNNQR